MTVAPETSSNVLPFRPDPKRPARQSSDFVSWYDAGFHDLVPVTPPTAVIATGSKLEPKNLGKAPGLRMPLGSWTGFPNWRHHKASRTDVETWRDWQCNAGIACLAVAGVDLDIWDGSAQDAIDHARLRALQILGPAPVRVGQAPKQLLMYRVTQPARKMRIVFRRQGAAADAKPFIIEVLGAGQQFVIEGTHPSGTSYTWDVDPRRKGVDKLTEVTPEQLERFVQTMGAELVNMGYEIVASGSARTDREDVDQDRLVDPDLDRIARAVAAIPNDNVNFAERTSYIRMGVAIKAAFKNDEPRGLEVFKEWALRWPGADGKQNDEDQIERDWGSLNPPFAIGADYLIGTAFRFGHQEDGEFSVAGMFEDVTKVAREGVLIEAMDWTKGDIATMGDRLKGIATSHPGILDEIVDLQQLSNGLTMNDFELVMKLGVDTTILDIWTRDAIFLNARMLIDKDRAGELSLPLGAYFDGWQRNGTMDANHAFATFGLALLAERGRSVDFARIVTYADAALSVYGQAGPVIDFGAAAYVLKKLMVYNDREYEKIANQLLLYPDWRNRGRRALDAVLVRNAFAYERSGDPINHPLVTDHRPAMQYQPHEMDRHLSEMLDVLADSGDDINDEPVFQQGRTIVTVRPVARSSAEGSDTVRVEPFSHGWMAQRIMRTVRFKVQDGKTNEWLHRQVPDGFVHKVMDVGGALGKLRPLNGVTNIPLIGPDGRVLDTPGYDRETGLFVHFGDADFNVAGLPRSREAALTAYKWLAEVLLDGFEFATPCDETVAVSALLSLLVRRLISQAPGYLVTAPIRSSGKTTLVQVVAEAILGETLSANTWPHNEEEFTKSMMSWLRSASSAVLLDNIRDGSKVDSPTLAEALTSSTVSGRTLGTNEIATVRSNVVWFLTGNGLTVSRDMTTRLLTCTIEPNSEMPEHRVYTRANPISWARTARIKAVRHALTIILSYLEAKTSGVRVSRGSRFEEWDGLVRQPLLWLFDGSPERDIGRQFDTKTEEDRQTNPNELILQGLRSRFGLNNPFTVKDVKDIYEDWGASDGDNEPVELLREGFGEKLGKRKPSRNNLRAILVQVTGRVLDGIKLTHTVTRDDTTYQFSRVS
jgi:hypothetical protein